MALTDAEQKELDQLEYDKLTAEKHASTAPSAPAPIAAAVDAPSPEGPEGPHTLKGLLQLPGKIADKMGAEAADMEKIGWENLTPPERLKLMMLSVPRVLGNEVLGAERKAEGMAERTIPTVAGQFVGRATRIPGADRIGGALGAAGGEVLAEFREGGDIKPGNVFSAAMSGLIRGKPLANAIPSEVSKEAAKYAGVALAGKTAETLIDEGRLPTPGEAVLAAGTAAVGAPIAKVVSAPSIVGGRAPLYNMEMDTLRDLRKEGVVIPPHEIGQSSETLANMGGKAALQQEAAKRNQFVWQKLARQEVGLSKEALPISRQDLRDLREQYGAPYREIQTIQQEASKQLEDRMQALAHESDPHAAMIAAEQPAMKESISILKTLADADVDALKEARFSAQRSQKAFFAGDPNAYEPWQKAKAEATRIEDNIERAAASLKDSDLLDRLKDARQKIAKTYNVEESLNPGNGFVDPTAFGRQLLNGEKLSGNLEKIGKFQLAFRREAVESGRVPAPGVGNLGLMATTEMASRGNAPGVLGAIANATVGRAARPFLLSDFVQSSMLSPKERQNFAAAMARYAAENLDEPSSDMPNDETMRRGLFRSIANPETISR